MLFRNRRRQRRRRSVLAREPGSSLGQNVELRLQLLHLATQRRELIAHSSRQALFGRLRLAGVDSVLRDPIADRLR